MPTKQQTRESDKTPKPESEGRKSREGRPNTEKTESKAEMVEGLIRQIRAKLQDKQSKATLGDFIRLLQLQREMDEDSPKEVRVTWVETAAEESATET